jgi:enoyl-CoA hydratase
MAQDGRFAGIDRSDAAAQPPALPRARRLKRDFDFITRRDHRSRPLPRCMAIARRRLRAGDGLRYHIAAEDALLASRSRFGSVITALMMPWLVGPKRAKELLLTGQDRISAQGGKTGLHRMVPQDKTSMACGCRTDRAHGCRRGGDHQTIHQSNVQIGTARGANPRSLPCRSKTWRRRSEGSSRITRQGLKAAIAWRDGRFAQRGGLATAIRPRSMRCN